MKIIEQRIERDGPLYVVGTLAERRQIPAAPPGLFPRSSKDGERPHRRLPINRSAPPSAMSARERSLAGRHS